MSLKKLVIGISGVNNGGKSSLCKRLSSLFPRAKVFHQDDYFYPEDSPKHVPSKSKYGHHNWDVISSVDMDNMVAHIQEVLESSNTQPDSPESCKTEETDFEIIQLVEELEKAKIELVFLDGFILFDDPRIHRICDVKLFLTLSKDECQLRRLNRVYDPPDPLDYFEVCAWPMYVDHLERIKSLYKDIHFLDGCLPKDTALKSALNLIIQSL